ncbi:chitin binding domain-containing protein [Desmonostoc muscorum LEGE 12446]|uniref:Chitin binding domain-containing protein n=1 Tax=Desmonostoc muscorum LEGE 12446 TaxID=1828758 RepID=A0A8J7AGP6_DESMC|nr:chitin binding peritrophin-A domain-containing protein [Desmonostoc muscorum]MCF2146383.1 chitin binding domain-containing protein [Desmonostoc muscorum LEGE 12446]
MKKFVLLVISAFLVIVAVSGLLLNKTQAEPVGSCPADDGSSAIVVHLPHDTRCDVYYRCQQGVPILMPCPDGTYFNAKLEVCDWPEDSGCTPQE